MACGGSKQKKWKFVVLTILKKMSFLCKNNVGRSDDEQVGEGGNKKMLSWTMGRFETTGYYNPVVKSIDIHLPILTIYF